MLRWPGGSPVWPAAALFIRASQLSKTAALISCTSPKCSCGSPRCGCTAQQCTYTRSYAEQSSSSGVLLEDVLAMHDGEPEPQVGQNEALRELPLHSTLPAAVLNPRGSSCKGTRHERGLAEFAVLLESRWPVVCA